MNKRILIVGAGFGQLPAFESSEKLGLEIITVDKNPDALGMKLADYAYPIDIIDKERILEIALKHNVNGVLTMQSDLPVPTIGYINDHLNLKGVSYKTASVCSNKIETRKILKEKKCAQPDFIIVDNYNDAFSAAKKIGFPCIIKAPDSSGSRGVTKVKNTEEVQNAVDEAFKYSRINEIIVEEYIDGLEFGAQTFSVNGKCEIVLLHSDIISSPPYMIPIGHSFPFDLINDEDKKRAIEDIKNAVISLGIENGPANVDLILDKTNNRIKIIEIGARIGATCLPELVNYHTGIDWVEQTILNTLDENIDLEIKQNIPVTAFIIEANKDGILTSYEFPERLIKSSDLLEYEITAKIGEEVNILRKGTDRIGKVIYKGNTVEETIDNCRNFIEHTEIVINEA